MEFPHIVILDGGWKAHASEEQRRLLYVGMTRAKETLSLMQRRDCRNPFLAEMTGDHTFSRDVAIDTQTDGPEKPGHYAMLALKDFALSFSGQYPAYHPIHRHLGALVPGSLLSLVANKNYIELTDGEVVIARLSQKARSEWADKLETIERVTVIAMVKRYRDDSDERYQSSCKVDQWEVPIVEVYYRK
jgi:ATP-dependent DNA helicase RecQ